MKKFKALGILISLLGIGAVIIPTGGAAFFYGPTEVSESHPGYLEYDPVRENHIFNDQYDFVYAGQEFYDVYFAAQIAISTNCGLELVTAANLSTYNTFSITNPTYNGAKNSRLGQFSDGSYYKVIEEVTSVSTSELNAIGQPTCLLKDRERSDGGELSFVGWALTPISCYATVDDLWPTGFESSSDGYDLVRGYYPFQSEFTAFSANVLLSNFDGYKQNIDNDGENNDLVIYPIYSSAKNYYYTSEEHSNFNNLRDAVTITIDGESSFMLFDGSTSTSFNSIAEARRKGLDSGKETSGIYSYIFRYDNAYIEEGNISFTIDIDRYNESWEGSGHGVVTFNAGQSSSSSNTGTTFENNIWHNITGYYNIYLLTLTVDNTCGTGDRLWDSNPNSSLYLNQNDLDAIKNAADKNNIHPSIVYFPNKNWSYETNSLHYHGGITSDKKFDQRSFAVIFERLYEPQLIGGPTGGMTYQEGQTYAEKSGHEFVRFSSNGNNNVYRIMNVPLDGSITNNYSSQTGVDVEASSQWFAIQAASDASLTYPMGLVDDSNINTLPVVTVNGQTEYFYSETYLKNLQGYLNQETRPDLPTINGSAATASSTFPLLHVNDPGNYDIEIHINLEDFAAGSTTPAGISSIDIYLHKRVVHFINIIENTLDSIIENTDYYREDDGLKNYLKTDSNHYAYRCDQFREGEYLSGDTLFYKSGTLSSTITFRSLLGEYENLGYALMDIVTGRIFTADNVDTDPFLVDRSCILVYIPLSNLQKGEEIR